MRPCFDEAFNDLMDLEGWDVPHRVEGDSGGLTVYGIAENYHPEVYEDGLPTEEEARQFYLKTYWFPLRCQLLASHKMAFELFEFSVNSGDGTNYEHAVAIAQKATNEILRLSEDEPLVVEDGVMGPNTLEAMNRSVVQDNIRAWVKFFNHFQLDYYMSLSEDLQRRFLLGWTRRT